MKPLAVVLAAVAVVFTAGCSSSNNAPSTPPPVTGGFTNADLNGTYAFSMSGTDAGANFGAFIARVGSFTADGNGHITAALEDVTDAASLPQLVQFTGGSYSIQANGRGTLTLLSSTGGLQMSIALNSGNAGVMIQIDLNATSSGSFRGKLQRCSRKRPSQDRTRLIFPERRFPIPLTLTLLRLRVPLLAKS